MCTLELRSSLHPPVNVSTEHPRDFSCQPERRRCPPGEAICMNTCWRLRKQTEENSTSTDFHRFLNNPVATTSLSSTAGEVSSSQSYGNPITAPAAQPPHGYPLQILTCPPRLTCLNTEDPTCLWRPLGKYPKNKQVREVTDVKIGRRHVENFVLLQGPLGSTCISHALGNRIFKPRTTPLWGAAQAGLQRSTLLVKLQVPTVPISLRAPPQGQLSASKTQAGATGEATVTESHLSQTQNLGLSFPKNKICCRFYGLDPTPRRSE